jgi:hypothetical protein
MEPRGYKDEREALKNLYGHAPCSMMEHVAEESRSEESEQSVCERPA